MNLNPSRYIGIVVLFAFLVNTFGAVPLAQADNFVLPAPGTMVPLSPAFNPPILKGIKVHPENPFRFEFILDKGDSRLADDRLKEESTKLIKYFLASLTIPEKDLWVNLSPYEKSRIIPQSFGFTEMGRDLLAEDYMLKQITASLLYPEGMVGKKFWKRAYEESAKRFGSTNISINTFNKVWIVPDKAVVYENAKAGTAYVVEGKLKVMLEQDYLSLEKHVGKQFLETKSTSALGSQIVREIIIPQLTKEVNEGNNFARLRQVYNSLILATWYKKKIKDGILDQVYADKNKVSGIRIADSHEKEKIYQRYLQAFKKGVYNFIREEHDPQTHQEVPKKYYSGGILAIRMDAAMRVIDKFDTPQDTGKSLYRIKVDFSQVSEGKGSNGESVSQGSFYDLLRQQDIEVRRGFMSILQHGLRISSAGQRIISNRFLSRVDHQISDTQLAAELGYGQNFRLLKNEMEQTMSRLRDVKEIQPYAGMPKEEIIEQDLNLIGQLIAYDDYSKTAAPWLRGSRSNDPQEIRMAVFGMGIDEWVQENESEVGGALIKPAAVNLMKRGDLQKRLSRKHAETGIEIIRYASGNNPSRQKILLGTSFFNHFIIYGLRPVTSQTSLSFPNFPLPVEKYVTLIACLGTMRIQNYVNSQEFKAIKGAAKMDVLLKELRQAGFEFDSKDARGILLDSLPWQITASVTKEDLYGKERLEGQEDLETRAKKDGTNFYYKAKLLAEILNIPFDGRLEDFQDYLRANVRELLDVHREGGVKTNLSDYVKIRQIAIAGSYLAEYLKPFNRNEIEILLKWLNEIMDNLEEPFGESLELSAKDFRGHMTPEVMKVTRMLTQQSTGVEKNRMAQFYFPLAWSQASGPTKAAFMQIIDKVLPAPKQKTMFMLAFGLDGRPPLQNIQIEEKTGGTKEEVNSLKIRMWHNLQRYMGSVSIEPKEIKVLFDALFGVDPRSQQQGQDESGVIGHAEPVMTADPQLILEDIYSRFRFYHLQRYLLRYVADQYLTNENPEEWAVKVVKMKNYDLHLSKDAVKKARGQALRTLRLVFLTMPKDYGSPRQVLKLISRSEPPKGDGAMATLTRGGIDFTVNRTSLKIQNAGQGIQFHMDPAMLRQLQKALGFVPVVISIQLLRDLRGFLTGVN